MFICIDPAAAVPMKKCYMKCYVQAAMMRFIQQYDANKSAKTQKKKENQVRCPPPHQHCPSPSRSTWMTMSIPRSRAR